MKQAVIGITVVDAHTERHRTKSVPGRDFYALTYRFSGRVTVEANGVRINSTPDTVTFTPAGMAYKTSVKESMHMIAVHFRLAEDLPINTPAVLNAAGTSLSHLFLQLKERYRSSDPLDFECMSIFYRILSELEHLGGVSSSHPFCVIQARKYIDTHFSNAELSVSALAAHVGVSDSYLRRAFRASLGHSPASYLSIVRITHARELLESEYMTLSEIAQKCGFHSTGYFIQAFRAQTGQTPGAYRRQGTVPQETRH